MELNFDLLLGGNPQLWFGIAASLLSVCAFVPYVRDTLVGHTRPDRATWLIWSALGSIALASQVYEGATASLGFAGVQVGATIIIFVLSITRGAGAFWTRRNGIVLGTASIGIMLWVFTESSAYALAVSISVSLLGGCVTIHKAFRMPQSETLCTWVISFVASGCAILSINSWDPLLLAYPVYLLSLYAGI